MSGSRSSGSTSANRESSDRASPGRPFDEVTDEELEIYLSRLEEEKSDSPWNFSTVAGLSLIVVGVLYLLQQLGLADGLGVTLIANMLPWLAGVLIILVGFGVLSRDRSSARRADRVEPGPSDRDAGPDTGREDDREDGSDTDTSRTDDSDPAMSPDITRAARDFVRAVRRTLSEKRLTKSRDRKIAGVCAGLAEYVGVDPTLMRIAWVAAAIFGLGSAVLLYLILILVMPGPDDLAPAEKIRVTISRD